VTLCDKGGILNFVTSHFKNSIKTILQVSTKMFKFLSFINISYLFYFVNVLFIFIPMFDLMFILLKNSLNINKNNFGTAVLIE